MVRVSQPTTGVLGHDIREYELPTGFYRRILNGDYTFPSFHCEHMGLSSLNCACLGFFYWSKGSNQPPLKKPRTDKTSVEEMARRYLRAYRRIKNEDTKFQTEEKLKEDSTKCSYVPATLKQIWVGGFISGIDKNVAALKLLAGSLSKTGEEAEKKMNSIVELMDEVQYLVQLPGKEYHCFVCVLIHFCRTIRHDQACISRRRQGAQNSVACGDRIRRNWFPCCRKLLGILQKKRLRTDGDASWRFW